MSALPFVARTVTFLVAISAARAGKATVESVPSAVRFAEEPMITACEKRGLLTAEMVPAELKVTAPVAFNVDA